MNRSQKYKYSAATPPKQESYRSILELNMTVLEKQLAKHSWINRELIHIDLHSGPGVDPNGDYGSPLVFARVLTNHDLNYQVHLYEQDAQDAYPALVNTLYRSGLDGEYYHLHCADNTESVLLMAGGRDTKRRGTVYADPSDAELPVQVFSASNSKWPGVDLIVNLAAASYKRQAHLDHYQHLEDQLKLIGKEYWLIREPLKDPPEIARFQWTMLILTNWKDYPASKGFYDVRTPLGREIFDKVAYTKIELAAMRAGNQMELFV